MAYENINFKYNNFCIAPVTNTFASVDTTNATSILQIKNSTGTVQANYDLEPTLTQDLSIDSLVYTGPTNTSTLADGMPFFTLEHTDSSNCVIKRWELSDTYNKLVLAQTINMSNYSAYNFDCYSMSVENYNTTFSSATAPDTNQISITTTTRIEVGDKLYLGPSSHTANTNAFEIVNVTSISGGIAQIVPTVSGNTATNYYYNYGDPITYYKDILLFSDIGSSGDTTKGSLFRINPTSGLVVSSHSSGLYKDVKASSYGKPYSNTVAFAKNSNIFYVDIDDFEVKKSVIVVNTKSDNMTVIPVQDLAFTTTNIYRLQGEITLRTDTGAQLDYDWTNYNYHMDGVPTYVDNITLWASPCDILHNQEQVTIYALVRDQYGVALSNITVYFDKLSGDINGDFDDINKQAVTNIDGIASLTYTCGWSDPVVADLCCEDITITAYAAGSNVSTGSQYVWATLVLSLHKKYIFTSYAKEIKQRLDSVTGTLPMEQLAQMSINYTLPSLSKFWFPGGSGDVAPINTLPLITQQQNFTSTLLFEQLQAFNSMMFMEQIPQKSNTLQLSQTYISRHLNYGNIDNVTINQFRFLLEAIPDFWSEKNSKDTDIWIKLAPFGFDLDPTTLEFNIREVSYFGDTGYVDYANTSHINVVTFDAGGGLLGLEITVDPPQDFHHNAVVYVFITVYDKATPSNKIMLDYWFRIIADYKAPYITNEQPAREAQDVAIDTNISFDIVDLGVGVDISTLEVYVNNRFKPFTYTTITNGFNVVCSLDREFHYGQTVEITVVAYDSSDQRNVMFDTYRFYCVGSSGPWFDPTSFSPADCKSGVYRKIGEITMNVYELNDTGIDRSSIKLDVDSKNRPITTKPILLRIE